MSRSTTLREKRYLIARAVECLRGAAPALARAKHGHAVGLLLRLGKRRAAPDLYAGSGWTCRDTNVFVVVRLVVADTAPVEH